MPNNENEIEVTANEVKNAIKNQEVVIHNREGTIIEIKERPKEITVAGNSHTVNALELARMVRNVTQQIGHHKRTGNTLSSYMLNSLRTMRSQMVSDLEHHFRIGHVIGDSGKSIFYKLGRGESAPEMLPRNSQGTLPRNRQQRRIR